MIEVIRLGTIQVDITVMAREKRAEIKKTSGRYPKYLKIDVDIELTMSSDKGILEAIAKSDRQKVGSTTIRYAAAPAWDSALVRVDDEE